MKVGIVGLGAIGSMALWQLAKKGVDVTGFEQFGIGHDRSGVGGESRLFRVAYKEGAQYVPLLKEAQGLWRDLERETTSTLLHITGSLNIGLESDEGIANTLKSIQDFDIKHEILDFQYAKNKFIQHNFLPEEIIIFDKESGYIRPELAVFAAVNRAEQLGAKVNRHAKVERIDFKEDSVQILANEQKYEFDQVIIASGAWTNKLINYYQKSLTVKKVILSWFPAKDISLFTPDHFPVFTRRSAGYFSYGVPTIENSMVKIGISIPSFDVSNPDQWDRTVTNEELQNTIHVVKTYLNGLYSDPIRLNAYMDSYSEDRHPLIGRLENAQQAIIASGFSGHGFKMAPAIGSQLANLVVGNKQFEELITPFKPKRFLGV